jgi:hypothetical protein
MTNKPEPINPNALLKTLCDAINMPYAQRIVLDVEYGKFPTLYVQATPDANLLKVDWAGDLKDSKVIVVGEPPKA